jgi:hypothetical protein
MVQTWRARHRLGTRVAQTWFAFTLAALLLLPPSQLLAEEGLTAALARLGSDSVDERRAATEEVQALGSTGSGAIDVVAQLLNDLGRSGEWRPPRSVVEQRPAGGKETDFVEALVGQKPDPAVTRTLAAACLMRALARIGTTPAVRKLVRTASDAGSPLRQELFRDLKQLDDRASAALIEMQGDPSPEVRTWAKDLLDALGKRTPGDAVQTTSDQVLVDVLRAYAAIRDVDALPVVLSFVNSERLPVRTAAREATLAYGPDALAKLRATHAALTGKRVPDDVDAHDVAQGLFEAYDRYRLGDVYARLDAGLAKQRNGDIDGAVVDFDNVLARQPVLDRGDDIVGAYVTYAEAIEPADRTRANDYLRKALRLAMDNAGPQLSHIRSEMRFLEGADLMSQGIVDTTPFEQALTLDPSNAHARAQLNRLRVDATSRRNREGHIAAAVGAAGLSFLTVGLFALRMHRRRFAQRHS